MSRLEQIPVPLSQIEELEAQMDRLWSVLGATPQGGDPALLAEAASLDSAISTLDLFPMTELVKSSEKIVDEAATRLKKQVRLEFQGVGIQVPSALRPAISTFLLHGLRNAIDHGIESPAERRQSGKSECGVIEIQCLWSPDELALHLQDDGRGTDFQAVHDKASASGLIQKGQKLGDDALTELLFSPQFSLKTHVSVTSGRGIGLSAVKVEAEEAGGQVLFRSSARSGSDLSLQIPLRKLALETSEVRFGEHIVHFPSHWLRPADQLKSASDYPEITLRSPVLQADGAFLAIETPTRKRAKIRVDSVGNATLRVYRRLDPSWKGMTSSWLGSYLQNFGSTLAARSSFSAEGLAPLLSETAFAKWLA